MSEAPSPFSAVSKLGLYKERNGVIERAVTITITRNCNKILY